VLPLRQHGVLACVYGVSGAHTQHHVATHVTPSLLASGGPNCKLCMFGAVKQHLQVLWQALHAIYLCCYAAPFQEYSGLCVLGATC
jgi:hypothetical protein